MIRVENPKARPLAGEGAFSCLQCGAKFVSLQALGGHKSVHSGKRRTAKNQGQAQPAAAAAAAAPHPSALGFFNPGFPQFGEDEAGGPHAKRQRTAHGWAALAGHGTPPPEARAQSPAEAMATRQLAVRMELQELLMASAQRRAGPADASATSAHLAPQPWLHHQASALGAPASLAHCQHAAGVQAGRHALLKSALFPPFGGPGAPLELPIIHTARNAFPAPAPGPASRPAPKARSMSPWANPAQNPGSTPSLSPLSRTSRMQPAGLSTASLSPKSRRQQAPVLGVPMFSPYFASPCLADVSTTLPSLATASMASGPVAHPAHASVGPEPASACATSRAQGNGSTPLHQQQHSLVCESDSSASFLEAAAKRLVSLGARQARASGRGLSSQQATPAHEPEAPSSSRRDGDNTAKGTSTVLELCSSGPPAHPILQLGLGSPSAEADAGGDSDAGEATCGSSNGVGSPRRREGSLRHLRLGSEGVRDGHATQEQALPANGCGPRMEKMSCRKALLKAGGGAGRLSPLDLTLSLRFPG